MRRLIEGAIASGSEDMVIPAGTYRGGPPAGQGTCITVSHAHGLRVRADGVRMICTERARAFTLDHCQLLTIEGLTIDYDPLPFTQGSVVAIGSDGTWIDLRIHQGYAIEAWDRIDLIDPLTRYRKRGMPFLWHVTCDITTPGVVRVHQPDLGTCVSLGDYVTLSAGSGPGMDCHGIVLDGCALTTLRNVTLHTAPVFGIADHGGDGRTHLVDCRIIPGPPPPGATIPPLLSTTADGVNHNSCRKGPVVEGCTFIGCGDDTWSLSASDYVVLEHDDATLVLAARDEWAPRVEAGDRLQQALDGPVFTIGSVQSHVPREKAHLSADILQKLKDPKSTAFWRLAPTCDIVTLDHAALLQPGVSVWSPDRVCAGAIFRNNHIHSSGRILLRGGAGSNALIEGNELKEPHAIVIAPELAAQSSSGVEDVRICNNAIVGSGYCMQAAWSDQAGAICVVGPLDSPVPLYRRIDISGNTLQDIHGLGVLIADADQVTVANNQFLNMFQSAPPSTGACIGVDQQAAIYVTHSHDVTYVDNVITNPGTFFSTALKNGSVGVTVDAANTKVQVETK